MKKQTKLPLSCLALALAVLMFFSSCVGVKSPPLEEVYDRAVELIEASAEINEIFFGEGLPHINYEEEYQKWCDSGNNKDGMTLDEYLLLMEDDAHYYPVISTEYTSVEDIKTAAEKVYSREYLEEVYENAFVGMVSENGTVTARYWNGNEGLMILKDADVWITSRRIYDYSTMKMGRSNQKNHFYIEIMSRLEDEPDSEPTKVRLGFVLQDGEWFLDSPTY